MRRFRLPNGHFGKGNSFAEGNRWEKIYDPKTLEMQRERIKKMVLNRKSWGYNKGSSRAVFCNTNGKIYPNIRAASKELGISDSSISKVCKGIYKQVKGFRFEYYYED